MGFIRFQLGPHRCFFIPEFLEKWQQLVIFSFKIRCSTISSHCCYHHRNHGTSPRLERFPSLKGWREAPLVGTCVWTWSVDAHGCETGSYKEDEQCRKIYEREGG
jgi:hypothetical protein